MLRAIVLLSALAACAGLQVSPATMRTSMRAVSVRMQEQPEQTTAEEAADGPFAASKPVGSNSFGFEGIGKPSMSFDGKLTAPQAIDESKRMSAGIPFPYLYGAFALFIAGGFFLDDPSGSAAHGIKLPF